MTGESLYSTAFRVLPHPALILKSNIPIFTIVGVNDAYLDSVNMSRESLVGKGFFEVFSTNLQQNNAKWENIFDKVLREKRPITSSLKKYKGSSNDIYSWEIEYIEATNTPVLNDEGEVTYIIRSLEDMTKSTIYKELMDKTQEVASIGSWQLNPLNKTLTCSQNLRDIYEIDADFQLDIETSMGFFEDQKTKDSITEAFNKAIQHGDTFCNTLPIITGKGNKKWLLITGKADIIDGVCVRVYGISQDITESKSLAEMDKLEKGILELNEKRNISIKQILSEYLGGIESLYPELYCSIHRVQDGRLLRWVAPSLPEDYLNAIHQLPIGENVGSCGTAAYLKKPVYTSDIANAPEWEGYAHLPLLIGLKACWSYPIIDSDDNVIAVFGIYYKQVREPNEKELMIIERAGTLLQLILENRLKSDMLLKVNEIMEQTQELTRFGNWQWNMETNQVHWSNVLFDIYGVNAKVHHPSFENYLAAVHEEDRQKIIDTLQHIRQTGKDAVFEERVVRPNGEIRYLKSWARMIDNGDDTPPKMIGACLDITEVKLAEMDLKNLYVQQKLHLQQIIDSEKKYSDLFHLSPQPIWVCDPVTHKIIDVNAAAVALYGYTHDEFTSIAVSDIVSARVLSQEKGSLPLPNLFTEFISKNVLFHRKKNGEIIYVIVLSKCIELSGEISEVMIIQDVTEKLGYVEAIELQNRKLQEIAWMQSHLVRAPLARIMGLADLIQNVLKSDMETSELLTAISQSATELDNVLRPIIDKAEQIKFT